MALLCSVRISALAVTLSLLMAGDALAFLNNGRWSATATDGATAALGYPVTLTWSIVPDGTTISHLSKPSDLISVFDGLFPGSTGVALEEKPWFQLVRQCFDRWSEVSGLTFVYEPVDDGLTGHPHGLWQGQLNARGDVRLGGALIPTAGTLAESGFIPNADITINTGETAYYGNSGGNFPYINLRTTLMHEIGHSLGLGHSVSNNAAFLMEGFSQTGFDGPQLDDIRGVQYLYGDAYERTFDGAGNGSIATATPLGSLHLHDTRTVGEHAATGTVVLSTESDFVSIANSSDDDYYSFSLDMPSLVDLVVTPLGVTYHERGSLNSSSMSNLSLELYTLIEESPVLVSAANSNPVGLAESLLQQPLQSGREYFVRINGTTESLQLYQLSIAATDPLLLGDFNADGVVDAADYSVWRNSVGSENDAPILLRGDGVPGVGQGDYAVWKAHFGEAFAGVGTGTYVVPEPTTGIAVFAGILGLLLSPPRRELGSF